MNLTSAANIITLTRPEVPVEGRTALRNAGDGRQLLARQDRIEPEPHTTAPVRKPLLIGLDLGARRTRIAAVVPGVDQYYLRRTLPTAVAYHALPDEKTISPFLYFGEEAVSRGGRFRIVHPWQAGDLADPVLGREFVRHLRELMRRTDLPRTRAVVGVPATMSPEGRHHLAQTMRGLLDEVIFLPRPYLTALGLREQLGEEAWEEHSGSRVFVADLGAGSTEVCGVGGCFPAPEEMRGAAFGGDDVELLVQEVLRRQYAALRPSREMIRGWLENFGFVGRTSTPVMVKVPVDGTEQVFDLTRALGHSGEVWAMHVQQLLLSLLTPGEGTDRPTHVFLCGGGSRLDHLGSVLGQLLVRAGHAGVTFSTVEEKELSLAARGALCAARKVREEQWSRFELV